MKQKQGSYIPQIIAILMLLWALYPENPYGYYIMLRIVLCAICAFLAFRAYDKKNESWVLILGVMAVIYNPFIRLHMTREIWTVVNLATIFLLGLTFITLHGKNETNQKGDPPDEY